MARTFRLAGLAVGGAGVLLGTVSGVAICALLTATRAVRFPAEIARVYYISWMPFRPEPRDVLAIAVTGLLLVLLAAAFPGPPGRPPRARGGPPLRVTSGPNGRTEDGRYGTPIAVPSRMVRLR